MRRVDRLKAGGIVFHEGFDVGDDATLDELRARHDAILIATGVYKPRDVDLEGQDARGVIAALDYLTASNRKGFGDAVVDFDSGALDAAGKNVVVIGGGDTAMDCVRTAIRQGAASVKCLYRRDRANMPGSQREVAHAEEEGAEFVWLSAPQGFAGDTAVSSVKARRMRLGTADASGRRAPEVEPGGDFELAADMVIKALGFDAEDLPALFGAPELGVSRWGTVLVDGKTLMTSLDGVFAAGDIVRGASLVVWAVRDGRDVSAAMHAWLKAKAAREKVAA
jgi:glutamate synthase (NADPH/NADH) small chain